MAGIYIHIPFCRQACHYCNFHFTTSLHYKEALVSAIQKEMVLAKLQPFIPEQLIETIYFGGGTPSLLSISEVSSLLKTIRSNYLVSEEAEITLEANPDDVTKEKLMGWKAAGINRLSIGVQSFFEEDLQWMNRAHNARQAAEGLELAIGFFENSTMDLIYGVPGLTNARWKQNVDRAIAIGVPHLSCYALTVEPQTPLHKLIRRHKKKDIDAGVQSDQFLLLMKWMQEHGYDHYEISNFARPGYRSRHNSAYWNGNPYWGFGPAAHSFNGTNRRWNIANNQQYIQLIESGTIPFEEEILTAIQQLNERVMISLRTAAGINLERFTEEEQAVLIKRCAKFINSGKLLYEGSSLQLTHEGKLYADGIAADLFWEA